MNEITEVDTILGPTSAGCARDAQCTVAEGHCRARWD